MHHCHKCYSSGYAQVAVVFRYRPNSMAKFNGQMTQWKWPSNSVIIYQFMDKDLADHLVKNSYTVVVVCNTSDLIIFEYGKFSPFFHLETKLAHCCRYLGPHCSCSIFMVNFSCSPWNITHSNMQWFMACHLYLVSPNNALHTMWQTSVQLSQMYRSLECHCCSVSLWNIVISMLHSQIWQAQH